MCSLKHCLEELVLRWCRVIALAYKQLSAEPSAAELRQMSRSEAESGLTFAGFAIFQCPLKPESEPALRMLQESNHQVRTSLEARVFCIL